MTPRAGDAAEEKRGLPFSADTGTVPRGTVPRRCSTGGNPTVPLAGVSGGGNGVRCSAGGMQAGKKSRDFSHLVKSALF